MQIFLDDSQSAMSLADERVLLSPEGKRLRLALAAAEELAEAALSFGRDQGGTSPAFPAPAIETSAGADLSGITWIKADWGGARTVRSFSLGFAAASVTKLLVRVQIATGGSGWFPPPGPHSFTLENVTNATALAGTFPDTVADRVMFEFLDLATGVPATVSLDNPPLALGFGVHARDLGLRLAGGRDFFTYPGELAAGDEVAVPDLLALLHAAGSELRPDLDTPVEIVLELRAAVTGFVSVSWGFAANKAVRRFAGQAETRRLALPWNEPVREPLPLDPPGRPEALRVTLVAEPVPERIALQPEAGAPGEAVAALCRPLADNAQPFALALAQPLVGVDLWARPLTAKVTARIDIRADDGGRPAAVPNPALAGTLVIDDPAAVARKPAWWPVALDAPGLPPVAAPGERFWLCVQIDEGELLWFLGAQQLAEAEGVKRSDAVESPRYRRAQGDWLVRESGAKLWALARLRVVNEQPPLPPVAQIVLIDAAAGGDDGEHVYTLSAGPDNSLRWDAAELSSPVPDTITRVELSLTASVASTVTLTHLHLGYRPAADE
jgi:hypothetical protein